MAMQQIDTTRLTEEAEGTRTAEAEGAGPDGTRRNATAAFPEDEGGAPETSWDHLATLALGDEPAKLPVGTRLGNALRKPTVVLALAVAALAYPAYRGFAPRDRSPNFPGKNVAPVALLQEGESVVLKLSDESSRAPEVTVHDDKPALQVILVGPDDIDPATEWKVVVTHPGREIWKSKWARRFERVKDEWRLGFELDGRNLPEGPLTVLLEEAHPKGGEAAARRETYRLRVKRRG